MYEVEDMMLDGRINAGHTLASLALANTFVNRNPAPPLAPPTGSRSKQFLELRPARNKIATRKVAFCFSRS